MHLMIRFLTTFWTLWSLLVTVFLFFLLLPINLFLIFFMGSYGKNIFVRYNYYIGNLLLFLFGMYKQVSGCSAHSAKPCIYIVNHKSYLDVVIVASLISNKIKYLGKAEVFKWPLFGFLARHSGQIPVQREDKKSRQKGYDLMKEAIHEGFSIILFPEGGWKNNNDNKSNNPYNLKANMMLQNFRNGAFRLAKETNVSIVPIVLLNAQERFSDVTMRVSPGKVRVHVLEPVDSKLFDNSLDLNYKCHQLMLKTMRKYRL